MSNMSSKNPFLEVKDLKKEFNELQEWQKDQLVLRAKLLLSEYKEMEKDPIFAGLTYRTNIGHAMSMFIEKNEPIANFILEHLFILRKNKDIDDRLADDAIRWLQQIMSLLSIELDPTRFKPIDIINYWLPFMQGMKLAHTKDAKGEKISAEPSEAIIWNLLMIKAENIYGIRLLNNGSPAKWESLEGLCNILRDELSRLDRENPEEGFKVLISELDKFSEYSLFRYDHDSGWEEDKGSKELTSRETISILGNVSKKAVVNAGLKDEIEIIKIKEREDREPVTFYQTDSALAWLQNSKRRQKFNYLPSLKISNKYEDRDNFLVIPAENIHELVNFIKENSLDFNEAVTDE